MTNHHVEAHPFVDLMKKIEGSGTFSAFGKLDPIFPSIVIKNIGEISLPPPESQALQIIEQCKLAPFGRGEETIIDTQVRNVWQLSPTEVEFTNPDWNHAIDKACCEIYAYSILSDQSFHSYRSLGQACEYLFLWPLFFQ